MAITRGTPCESGKYGSTQRICASGSQIKSLMATPPRAPLNQPIAIITNDLMGSEPSDSF